MARSQIQRQFAVATPLGDDVLLFKKMTFRENLGRPFEMQLELLSEKTDIKSENLLGQNITVRCELPNLEEKTRYFNGIVAGFAQGDLSEGLSVYRLTVVPWLWFLTKTSDCRIFQEMAAPEIIKLVFRDLGFSDFRESLSGEYRTWEYCVQYRETAFAFVSRIMEQEGIYYYFEHENGKHTLVLIDDAPSHEPFPDYEKIAYRPYDRVLADSELIHEFGLVYQVQPGTFEQSDYDFTKPTKNLVTRSAAERPHDLSSFEMFDYPGEYVEPGEGDRYSSVRLDEHQCRFAVARGRGDSRGLAVGRTFALTDHPVDALNVDYLVKSVVIEAEGDPFGSSGRGSMNEESMTTVFEAIPAIQQFRPARVTPLPFVRGPQTATVVGPSGEEIHTDEHGRVKVMFHWDREAKADETSSCFIRVSQEFAGKKWGSMQIPRIGQEVIVSFLEGDPDRPIITGRVYNGDNTPPYDPKKFGTITTWKTNSSKGGGGFNELRFEDKKGKEMIWMHAQRRCDFRIRGSFRETNYGNREIRVGWEKDGQAGGDLNTYVHQDTNSHVIRDGYTHYEGNVYKRVDGDAVESIGQDRTVAIEGDDQLSATNILVQATEQLSQKCDAMLISGSSSVDVKAGAYIAIESNGDLHLKASSLVLDAGGSKIALDSSGIKIHGSEVDINTSPPGSASSAQEAPDAEGVELPLPLDAHVADNGEPGKVARVGGRTRTRNAMTITPVPVPPFAPPPPPPPPPKQDPARGDVVDESNPNAKKCRLTDFLFRCEHQNHLRKCNKSNELEIVASTVAGDTLTLEPVVENGEQECVTYELRGPDGRVLREFSENKCKIRGWTIRDAYPMEGIPGHFERMLRARAEVYRIRAIAENGASNGTIRSMPCDKVELKLSSKKVKEMLEPRFRKFTQLLTKFTGKRFDPFIENHIEIPGTPFYITVSPPDFRIQGECQWVEMPVNHKDWWKTYCAWSVKAGFDPLLGIGLKVDLAEAAISAGFSPAAGKLYRSILEELGPGHPPPLYAALNGTISGDIAYERKQPEGGEKSGSVEGKLAFEVGVQIHGSIVSASGKGTTSIALESKLSVPPSNDDAELSMTAKWGGFKTAVEIELDTGFQWSYKEEFTLMDGDEWYLGKMSLIGD